MALEHVTVFVYRKSLSAKGDRLINANPFADDAGLADDHAGAMVNEEARSDLRARMDVDAGGRMRDVRDQPCR